MIGRIDAEGNEPGWERIENDPRALVREVRRAGRRVPVAIEATYGWYWAVDALLAAKFDVHLAHPYGIKEMRARKRVETDPRDAYELANLLGWVSCRRLTLRHRSCGSCVSWSVTVSRW